MLYEEYWEKYKKLIYNLANKNEVYGLSLDDVVQELSMVLVSCIRNYKTGKAKFSTYLTKSCIYKIMELRKNYTDWTLPLDYVDSLEDEIIVSPVYDMLKEVENGELLRLHYILGVSQQDIALAENLSIGRVSQIIRQAREDFKEKFGDYIW